MKLLAEIKHDLAFIKGHTLQPRWFKVLKIFILLGLLAGYAWVFGLPKTVVFLGVFLSLSLLLHLVYRAGTHKFTRAWLDFSVGGVDQKGRPKRIGIYYYPAILANAVLAFIASQALF